MKIKMKLKPKDKNKVLEFVDYSKEYDTEKIMFDYFTDLIESPALAKFFYQRER